MGGGLREVRTGGRNRGKEGWIEKGNFNTVKKKTFIKNLHKIGLAGCIGHWKITKIDTNFCPRPNLLIDIFY